MTEEVLSNFAVSIQLFYYDASKCTKNVYGNMAVICIRINILIKICFILIFIWMH